ncbi:MAG: carbohydrate-binding domain-containing protein [Pontiella sp.]
MKIIFLMGLVALSLPVFAKTITVSSLPELLPYLEQNRVDIKVTPGIYTITAADMAKGTFGTPRFEFKGNNSTYDFTGVTINIAADVYTENYGMSHIQILGNDNVLKNLTLVDQIGKYVKKKRAGGKSIVIDGRGNRIEGFHVTVKGSFPYGYGDAFGKGGKGSTIGHSKHSACLVRGESNHVKNCTFIHRSYGHCIFMQAASNPIIEGCIVEGEIRSTADMLAEEGTGSPADKIDFLTTWGYRLPAGYMMSTGEEGIRAYGGGTTYIDGVEYKRGTSNPTVLNCTIKYMRGGVTLAHATGVVRVENCTTIGCEQGFGIGRGVALNCKSDVSHGHAFKSTYNSDSWDLDIEIIPAVDPYGNGQKCIAFIGMNHSEITLTGGDPNLPSDYRIQIGGKLDGVRFKQGNLSRQSTHDGNNNTIINRTPYPIEIAEGSSGNVGESEGAVLDHGSDNEIRMISASSSAGRAGRSKKMVDQHDRVLPGRPISGFDSDGLPIFEMNTVPCLIEAENYDYFSGQGNGNTYYDTTKGNRSGVYRKDDVDLVALPGGGFAVSQMEAGEWLVYTISVPEEGGYDVRVRYAAREEGSIQLSFEGGISTKRERLPVTEESNWSTQMVGRNLPLKQGVQRMTVLVSEGESAYILDYISIEPTVARDTAKSEWPVVEEEIAKVADPQPVTVKEPSPPGGQSNLAEKTSGLDSLTALWKSDRQWMIWALIAGGGIVWVMVVKSRKKRPRK